MGSIHVVLRAEEADWLRALAEQEGRPMTWVLRRAVDLYRRVSEVKVS
jgi:hypothetical protein